MLPPSEPSIDEWCRTMRVSTKVRVLREVTFLTKPSVMPGVYDAYIYQANTSAPFAYIQHGEAYGLTLIGLRDCWDEDRGCFVGKWRELSPLEQLVLGSEDDQADLDACESPGG